MKKGVFLTAFDRPQYFREVVESWNSVRWNPDWTFVIRIDPSDKTSEMVEIANNLKAFPVTVIVNETTIGAPTHPWVAFEESFYTLDRDYVLSTEDDLLVSSDFIEYHDWAAEEFYSDKEIATVSPYSREGSDSGRVFREEGFVSWGFGTWKDRWEEYIRDTWDGNYSTFESYPGDRSGWDWNLKLRVLPRLGKKTIFPETSRMQNIGIHGVHGTADNFQESTAFELMRPPQHLIER